MSCMQVVCDARSRSSNGCWTFISDRMLNLNRWAGLTEDEARFYIACVVLGLEGMHAKGLLHRCVGSRIRHCTSTLSLPLSFR